MKSLVPRALALAALSVSATSPVGAQDKTYPPSPAEIVAAAPANDWVAIASSDLVVMDLAPDATGKPRRVVIQLMPPPFSQGWVENIRTLARAKFWDGTSVNRVQDNYVVQWGDAEGEDPAKAKKLPGGLKVMKDDQYVHQADAVAALTNPCGEGSVAPSTWICDSYAAGATFRGGWPLATDGARDWPVHCYGMVGVGRGLSPDTGTGAELYTVIGHAPRHLDRNIAVVGRVIEGIEHLSSLPRGTGQLGFYETAAERVPIVSIRTGDAVNGLPAYQYLSTDSTSFARYIAGRANRNDAFFIRPAGGVDVCNAPVPVRRAK